MIRPAVLCLALGALPLPPGFKADHVAWRRDRAAELAAPEGWLSVVGLHWLAEGENAFGSDPALPVPLPKGKAPAKAGIFVLEGGQVRIKAGPGVLLEGRPAGERVLRTDAAGAPDVLRIGSLAFHVIQRGARFGIRVKDAAIPARRDFAGVPAWPLDPAYRVEARFEPYPEARRVQVQTVLGTTESMTVPGRVLFRLAGRDCTLEPVVETEGAWLLIFKDATSGSESYPAGRFLDVDAARDGHLVLDFNRAVNPPCAFTPFATCPLPPPQNWLPIAVRAGERRYGSHGSGAQANP